MTFSRRALTVEAELSRLPDVRKFVEAVASELGLDEDGAFQLKTAVNEAVANAIEHGSRAETDEVAVEAVTEDDALVFYVRDSGQFRPRVWRGGEISERGRGLEFINQMMDDVEVRPGAAGTEVRMAKRL